MPSSSPYGNFPIPASGDSDQVWVAFANYVAAMEPSIVRRFGSAAERTSYLTAAGLGTGIRGQITWLDNPGRHERFNGTAWTPLVTVIPEISLTGAIKGANWDGVSQIIEKRYSQVLTTNGTGGFTTTFATPFANGIFSVQMTPGDIPLAIISSNPSPSSLSSWAGTAYLSNGTAIASGSIRVEVNAIGW